MKGIILLLAIVILGFGCKKVKSMHNQEDTETGTTIDTIITGGEQIENNYSEEAHEISADLDEIYLPKIDSIIALFGKIDESGAWEKRENFQNVEFQESTEGNELLFFKTKNYLKYQLNTFGEMGKTEESFYFIKNELILYSHTDSRYNAPITSDSTMQTEEMPIFDETQTEVTIEDSYYKNGKIIYLACQDCGDPNIQDYLKEIEANVELKLKALRKLAK